MNYSILMKIHILMFFIFIFNYSDAQEIRQQKDSIYLVVDQLPSYPSGKLEMQKFISSNFKRPVDYGDVCLIGYNFIRFAVLTNGRVDSVKVARSVDPLLDNEAVRVVKSLPKWKPGEKNGRPVASWVVVRFNTSLDFD